MKKFLSLATASILLFGMLAGCGTTGGTSGSKGETGDILVGGDLELTGKVASYGTSTNEGIKLAFKQVNEKGGVLGRQIKWITADNKSDAGEATAAATKLMTENKLSAMIGAVASTNTLAMVPVATENKIPLITSASTNSDVTVKDGNLNEWIFRSCFIDPFQGQVAANYASNNLKVKTAAMLVDNSSDYSKGLASEFKKQFEKNGGKIVGTENFTAGDKDFKAVLTRIKGTNPDLIFVPGYYAEVGIIIKQARDAGIEAAMLGGDGWDSPELINIAGAASLNKAYFVNHVSADDPSVKPFVDAYKAEYSKDPDALAFLGYDAANILVKAIENAGSSDPEKIKDALANIKDFDGITGKISIDPATHNPVKSAVVIELKDGVQTFSARVNP